MPKDNQVAPLEKRLIVLQACDGFDQQTIAALDKVWAEQPDLTPLQVGTSTELNFSFVKVKLDCIDKILRELLQLEHHRFWSSILFESSYIAIVTAFLQNAVRCHESLSQRIVEAECRTVYADIRHTVFKIICRMITAKESETRWMSKPFLAEILYTKYLITVPLLFDMLVVYGDRNLGVLTQIFTTLFRLQPNYANDTEVTLKFFQNRMNLFAVRLSEPIRMDDPSYELLITSIVDCVMSLTLLLDVYANAANLCKAVGIEQSLANFYDNLIAMYKRLYLQQRMQTDVRIRLVRTKILLCFRRIVETHLNGILEKPKHCSEHIDGFVGIMIDVVQHKNFVKDYQQNYPIQNDFDIFRGIGKNVDNFKLEYLEKGFLERPPAAENVSAVEKESVLASSTSDDVDYKISLVLDILPDLKLESIERLLRENGNDEQIVISGLLDGSLSAAPPQARITSPPVEFIKKILPDIIPAANTEKIIYHKKTLNLIHKPDASNELNYNLKQKIISLSHDLDYDDEYDDTCDDILESKTKGFRHLNEESSESSDQDEPDVLEPASTAGQSERTAKNPLNFCENPETVRQRYEMKRFAKQGNSQPRRMPQSSSGGGGGGGSGGSGGKNGSANTEDGSKEKLLQEHARKSENKAYVGNHSRKQGANWKKSRGMY